MFLSRLSEKSQLAVLPLGLGSALNLLAAQAVASPPNPSQSQDLSLFDLLLEYDLEDAPESPLDASVDTVLGLSFLRHSAAHSPLTVVEGVSQPTFLSRATDPETPKSKSFKSKASGSKSFKQTSFNPTSFEHQASPALTSNAEGNELKDENSDCMEAACEADVHEDSAIALSRLLDAVDDSRRPSDALFSSVRRAVPSSDRTTAVAEIAPAGPSVAPTFSNPSSTATSQAVPNAVADVEAPNGETLARSLPELDTILPKESPLSAAPSPEPRSELLMAQQTMISEPIAQSSESQQLPNIEPPSPERATPLESSQREPDDELGELRLRLERSRSDEAEAEESLLDELGDLRTIRTAQVPSSESADTPIAFLSGRLGFFDTDNAFRIRNPVEVDNPLSGSTIDSQIYQAGLSLLFFPRLSKTTNLYATAETSIARYSDDEFLLTRINTEGEEVPRLVRNSDDEFVPADPIQPNYNEVELQLGLRQKLFKRTYAQLGWRNQLLFDEGYRDRKFTANYIDAQLSHRMIIGSKTWLDSFYQARVGFTSSPRANRFRQTFTLSLNRRFTRDFRTSFLYQLDFADYTRIDRFDTYQQLLGIISYNITPESRLSLFGGTRFGNSSVSTITLDDTFYGASINVTVPLF